MSHSFLRFLLVKNRANLIVIIMILFVIVVALNFLRLDFSKLYTNFLDPIISISTVSIAIVIWYFQQKNYWKESLPKRITVHFKCQGKVVMSCYEAYLSGASDARQWGQQIGGQMSNGRLNFFPYISSAVPLISKSIFEKPNGDSIDIMLYEITFFLRDDDFPNHPVLKNKYLIWIDNNSEVTDENRSFYVETRPDKPYTTEKIKRELLKIID